MQPSPAALFKYRVFRTIFGSFLGFLLVALVTLSGFQFVSYRELLLRETQDSGSVMLSQAELYMARLHEQILNAGQQLVGHRAVASAMLSRKVDRMVEYDAYLATRSLLAINPLVEYVGIHNSRTGRYLMIGGERRSDPVTESAIEGLSQSIAPPVIRQTMTAAGGSPESYLTFVFLYNSPRSIRPPGAVAITIRERDVQDLFLEIVDPVHDHIALYDEEFMLLTSYSPSWSNLPERQLAEYVGDETPPPNMRVVDVGGERSLVTIQRGAQTQWSIVWARSMRGITEPLKPANRLAMIMVASLMIIGVALSLWLARRLHAPIRALYGSSLDLSPEHLETGDLIDEYRAILSEIRSAHLTTRDLEGRLTSTLEESRNLYVRFLMEAGPEAFANRDSVMRSAGVSGETSMCQVCIVRMHSPMPTNARHEVQQCILDAAHDERCVVFWLEGSDIAVLLNSQEDDSHGSTEDRLSEIRLSVANRFASRVTLAAGAPRWSLTEIHESFEEARRTLEETFFQGIDHVIRYDPRAFKPRDVVAYPDDVTRQIWSGIAGGDASVMADGIDAFTNRIAVASYSQVLALSATLLKDIADNATASGISTTQDLFAANLAALRNCESFAAVVRLIARYCDTVTGVVELERSRKSLHIAERLERHIDENFHDPNISNESLGEVVSLSATYVGRLYKRLRHRSLADYLKERRLEAARSLLVSSAARIGEVAHAVGFPNESYFATVFRKRYGVTPNQFRINRRADPSKPTADTDE